jgi:hypothetical protein
MIVAVATISAPAPAQNASMEGRIYEYYCGDNCYLTILDKHHKEHTGLCSAPECSQWNAKTEMPSHYKGKRVVVTQGRGVQRDAGGNAMGRMIAFRKIKFLD